MTTATNTWKRPNATDSVIKWLLDSVPAIRWQYDVLRGLEYFRAVGELPAPRIGLMRRLRCSAPSNRLTADGCWKTRIAAQSPLRLRMEMGGRVAGIRCVPCGCWTGMQDETQANEVDSMLTAEKLDAEAVGKPLNQLL